METNQKQCLVVEVQKLSLEENPVGSIPVKEGRNLPNSVTEDIGGFSLMPSYSVEQLREISRRDRKFGRDSHTKYARKGWGLASSW